MIFANEALEKVASKPNVMRLRLIRQVTFGKSEDTNYEAIKSGLRGIKLDRYDVVLLVSKTENQVMFVYPPTEIELRPSKRREVLRSLRLRLRGPGAWNPYMIANYAEEVGIKLEGIKLFQEHYEQLWSAAAKNVAKRLGVAKELAA